MNETIRRFGYPATLIADYAHWVVMLRPAQPTLGSLVLAAKGEATAFSELEARAVAELHDAVVPPSSACCAKRSAMRRSII